MVAIGGYQCVYHSLYKGYEIYRAVNGLTERPMMLYFAVSAEGVILRSKNLSGIKNRVSEEAGN